MQRTQNLNPTEATPAPSEERKGSILVIVIALLGMLLLLGIAFYSFAAQEHVSAGYFAETYKERLPGISAETLFDYGLEQLIVGPSSTQTHSALFGRSHSLIGNMLGLNANSVSGGFFDPVLFNGEGINLALNGTNGPIVDLNFDGTADADQSPLTRLNFSAAANGGTTVDPFTVVPQPDAGYTYPDINSLYLSYLSEPADDVNGKRVIIPSFFRPQLLRDSSGAISATWYQDTGTGARSLRPHPEHLARNGALRFIKSTESVTNSLNQPVNAFPFAVDSLTNPNTTLGELGVWKLGTTDDDYDLDTDNDNDGTNEGIWLDLGFPAQTLVDGRRYVPLFSFTVQDADGLINLNTAGNFNQLLDGSNNYGDASLGAIQNIPISTSNLSISRTEVNPLWALWGWSASASNPAYPSLSAGQQNEFKYFMNVGGSMTRTAIANMELIHIKNGQQRDDGTGGDEYNVGAWGDLTRLQANDFAGPGRKNIDDDIDENEGSGRVTPIDLRGFGLIVSPNLIDGSTSDPYGLVASVSVGSSANPNRWLLFDSYLGGSTLPSTLTPGSLGTGTQIDEADETIVEPLMTDAGGQIGSTIQADSIYGTDEMLGLHLTNSEYTSVAGTSRLRKLVPINFSDAAVRKQFTTTSFDRAEFGWTPSSKRPYEIEVSTGRLFPYATDPLRPSLRDLLNGNNGQYRFRLNLNQLLTNAAGNPVYQALTSYQTSEAQANQDRVDLSRDLYLLLYSIGGGVDQDYFSTTIGVDYTPAQLAEMAQFAVNFVDAIDEDNVITIFNYDENPRDGWTPSAGKNVYGVEAQELTLSEALVIKTVDPMNTMADNSKTTFDDTDANTNHRFYTYLELRSVSPRPVAMGAINDDLGAWRIRVVNNPNSLVSSGTPPRTERFLYLIPTNGAAKNLGGEIPAGEQLLIGSRSRTDKDTSTNFERPSDFRVDYNGDNQIETIAPKSAEATVLTGGPVFAEPGVTSCDLDLVIHSTSSFNLSPPPTPRFKLYNNGGTELTSINDALVDNSIASLSSDVGFILERLADPRKVAPNINDTAAEAANPWIPVDKMSVTIQTFDVTNDSTSAALATKTSWERGEPFDIRTTGAFTDPSTPPIANSLGAVKNLRSPPVFSYWQPHFDRPLPSKLELLSIPLYGSYPISSNGGNFQATDKFALDQIVPNRLVRSQDMTNSVSSELFANSDTDLSGLATSYEGVELVAAKKILRPDYANDGPSGNLGLDNRWYRLLDLVDVSTESNYAVQWNASSGAFRQWSNTSLPPRLPGAINLNTIRHRGVLSGIIDDPDQTSHPGQFDFSSAPLLVDTFEANRNWWKQFVITRDGNDPMTSLFLPGLPSSRPYRDGGFVDQSLLSSQFTLLRDLVDDGAMSASGRNLFEARLVADQNVNNSLDSDEYDANGNSTVDTNEDKSNRVDYHTRHRLLRKVANNSTNRSNVFIVWMSVGYFEAIEGEKDENLNMTVDPAEDFNGNGSFDFAGTANADIRIGAPLSAQPEHRGFFIVDRTLLEEAEIENSPSGRRFDFKKFIVYKKTLK